MASADLDAVEDAVAGTSAATDAGPDVLIVLSSISSGRPERPNDALHDATAKIATVQSHGTRVRCVVSVGCFTRLPNVEDLRVV